MPELPDIENYLRALRLRILQQPIEKVSLNSPFLLRTVEPPLNDIVGKRVIKLIRIGKRIVFGLDGEVFMVLHLMIAGRLHWRPAPAKRPGKSALLGLRFPGGNLHLTEAGKKKRASLHLVRGEQSLRDIDPGGVDVLAVGLQEFSTVLTARNHTLKRALTDPGLFSGIGNAYSDEILHAAGLSPIMMSQKLSVSEIERLYDAVRNTLTLWRDRLQCETGDGFPKKSPPFVRRWRCTANTANPVRSVKRLCSASATRITKPTIARAARPVASCLRIGHCRAS